MNEHIQKLAEQASKLVRAEHPELARGMTMQEMSKLKVKIFLLTEHDVEKFAELMVYDFLNEITNDDSLGEARIDTIKRLAEKWGVANERTN